MNQTDVCNRSFMPRRVKDSSFAVWTNHQVVNEGAWKGDERQGKRAHLLTTTITTTCEANNPIAIARIWLCEVVKPYGMVVLYGVKSSKL